MSNSTRNGRSGASNGYIIERFVEPDTDMGIVYERFIGRRELAVSQPRAMLIFPRGACRVEVVLRIPRSRHSLTSTQLLYAPPDADLSIVGLSTALDLLLLSPSPAYAAASVTDNQLATSDAAVLAKKVFSLRRSRWMDDLVERYFFERVLNHSSPPGCPYFLEKQLINELIRLIFRTKVPTTGAMLGDEPSNLAQTALGYIEANLFRKLELADVCAHIKSSLPTLTRTFKKLIGKTPGAYIKERRLDEAAILIERGDYRVGDVCTLIGYDDLGSFSRAFKERFHASPTEYRESRTRNVT